MTLTVFYYLNFLDLTMLLLVLWRCWRHWIQIWSPISGCENTALRLSAPMQLETVGQADELSTRVGV